MKHITFFENEEYYLEFLIYSYFQKDKIFFEHIIKIDNLQKAICAFMKHFTDYDKNNNTNHVDIITKTLINRTITKENCATIGISMRTFYRYKHMYLETFKYFLINNEDNSVENA